MNTSRPATQAGFSFVEMMIAASLLTAVIAFVANAVTFSTRAIDVDESVAKAMESLQRSTMRIAQMIRPCSLGTYRVEATDADVPARAAAAGEWIEPEEGEVRTAISFQSAAGVVSMNAARLTSAQVLRFAMEASEVDNDADDDGDGWIDEGDVVLETDSGQVTMAAHVEGLTFALTGRVLTIVLANAARQRGGAMQRFSVEETLFMRNN